MASGLEAARGCPGPAGRVVEFRARGSATAIHSPCYQHHAIGQQGRGVRIASGVEAARGCPGPAGRIVELRARRSATAIVSPCHQHHAIGQQGRRMKIASGVEGARGRPGPAGRVVEFRARRGTPPLSAPPATSTMPLGSKVAVCKSRAVLRVPVAVQVPLAGS